MTNKVETLPEISTKASRSSVSAATGTEAWFGADKTGIIIFRSCTRSIALQKYPQLVQIDEAIS
jgi:hypothetical protein